jgi:hypothetical protein
VDTLRACYATEMALYPDSDVLTPVVWYWADPKGLVLPYATPFGSRIYDIEEFLEPPIGERYDSPRPWRNGSKPYPLLAGGLCGSESQWFNGPSAMDPLPPNYPGSDWPKCCSPPPAELIGQVGYGAIGEGESITCQQQFFNFEVPGALTATTSIVVDDLPQVLVVPQVGGGEYQLDYVVPPFGQRVWQYQTRCISGVLCLDLFLTCPFGNDTLCFELAPTSVDLVMRVIVYTLAYSGELCTPDASFTIAMAW